MEMTSKVCYKAVMERLQPDFSELYPNIFKRLRENLELLNGHAVSLDIDAVTQATYILMLNKASHDLGKTIHRDDLVSTHSQLLVFWRVRKEKSF